MTSYTLTNNTTLPIWVNFAQDVSPSDIDVPILYDSQQVRMLAANGGQLSLSTAAGETQAIYIWTTSTISGAPPTTNSPNNGAILLNSDATVNTSTSDMSFSYSTGPNTNSVNILPAFITLHNATNDSIWYRFIATSSSTGQANGGTFNTTSDSELVANANVQITTSDNSSFVNGAIFIWANPSPMNGDSSNALIIIDPLANPILSTTDGSIQLTNSDRDWTVADPSSSPTPMPTPTPTPTPTPPDNTTRNILIILFVVIVIIIIIVIIVALAGKKKTHKK